MIEVGARPSVRPWRLLALVAAAALALAACGGAAGSRSSTSKDRASHAGQSTSSASRVVAGARCQATGLSLGVATDMGALRGATVLVFRLTNVSRSACTLSGYPGLSLLSVAHTTLLANPSRLGPSQGFARPSAVRLAVRGSAWFVALIGGAPTLLCHAPVEVVSYPKKKKKRKRK
jgi:hypothetical protein